MLTEYKVAYVLKSYQQFKILVTLSAFICFISFFSRTRYGYLIGAAVILLGMALAWSVLSMRPIPVFLAILLVIVFFVNGNRNKRQEQEQSNT